MIKLLLRTSRTNQNKSSRLTFQLSSCYNLNILILSKAISMNILLPPEGVRGMKVFDIEKFSKKISVPTVEIDKENVVIANEILKDKLIKLSNFKPIRNCDYDNNKRVFILDPSKVSSFHDLNLNFTENFKYIDLLLGYENWKHEDIIRSVLPEDLMLSSYSSIGSIVHVNLKAELLEYKYIIGQVLKDKIKGCSSVVNKIDNIKNVYRNFEFEVLCGSSDLKTSVKENKCCFDLDFSEVYWNPRLCTEHERILKKLNSGDILYDVFAGIGPFSIPAAKMGCVVLANDLNPNCCKWLNINKKKNHIKDNLLTIFNKDGACFIKDDLKAHLISYSEKLTHNSNIKIHVTMNLPAIGIEFVKCFHQLFEWEEISDYSLPILHIYTFVKTDISYENGLKLILVENDLKNCDIQEIFRVRNVAPNKEMIRITLLTKKDMICKTNNIKRKIIYTEENKKTKFV
ncbi:tRNA (guanine(37)-N1)-methyltransferase-like isoform X1 [Daktulosphaira vitifoliae]|uniref:tRNA (guanine(37)-N1)-methyltransferase-like isoform X1 n=1 Tax=Daktulosphaira vitifoliae TaxID=58002 RepID=UPI0021A9D202|nr:tRNA (guanine(37)-N1)-methyltransferase-like isoform X1 [Daktulosphaira vitifoliae]